MRVGQTDVLRRQDDESSGDELGILTAFQHQEQPVKGGIRVGAPDALDEGRDDVVVLVPNLVVTDDPSLQGLSDVSEGYH